MRKLLIAIVVLGLAVPLVGCDYMGMLDASPKAETGHAPSYQVGAPEKGTEPVKEHR
jgi:hypothetical protein